MAKVLRNSLLFWIVMAFAAVAVARIGYFASAGGTDARESRIFFLQHALKTSRALVKENRARELSKYLRDGVSTGLIDFFEIEQKNKTEIFGSGPSARPALADGISEESGWVWGKAESEELKLRMASGVGWRSRLVQGWNTERENLPGNLVFLVLVLGASHWFQRRTRRQAAGATAASYVRRETKRSRLQRANAEQLASLEASDFEAICGRSSLRNPADLAAGKEGEAFFATLEEFYGDCASVVARYRGKVHAVQGHELVFYFSGSDTAWLAGLALAAGRDLDALARKRGFVLDTAFSYGRVHGGQLLAGYALLGQPIEETADMLNTAGSRSQSENTVWASEAVVKLVGDQARFSDKSKQRARTLVQIGDFAEVLAECKQGVCANLAFHRGDDAITELLTHLANDTDWTREAYVTTVNKMRQVQCRHSGPELVKAFRHLLAKELEEKDPYRLSSVLALAPHVLSRENVDKPLEKLFLQAIGVKDRRVRANTVEVFIRLFPDREVPELQPLIRDDDNRVSANALIKAACERFDEKVIARIEERVRGGSVAHVASALFAVGEIALYYRKNDPLFLGTKLTFLRLFENVPNWAMHPNPMIRRQALLAAKKLQSQSIDARLHEVFQKTTDPELVQLFAAIYHWHKEAALAAA